MKKILFGLSFFLWCMSSVSLGAYCTPDHSPNAGSFGDYIARVQLENLDNTTGPTPAPWYTFYNALIIPNLATGESYIFTGTVWSYGGLANYMFVWIDFNQDEVFDSGEKIGQFGAVVGNTTSSFAFTIPSNALTGQTRMRVIEHYVSNTADPCEVRDLWESEDYLVNIIPKPITITGPETGLVQFKWVGATFSLTGSLSYALTTGNVCNNTLSFTGYTSTIFFSDSYDGAGYQMCFRGVDSAAWHTYYAVSDVIDNIDTTSPTIISVNSGYTHFKSGSVILSWDVFDTNGLTGIGMSYKLTSDPWFANTIVQWGIPSNGTWSSQIGSGDLSSWMMWQPDGQYYILFSATDIVGNVATGGYSFIYDNTPPTLQYVGSLVNGATILSTSTGDILYAYFTDDNLSGWTSFSFVGDTSWFSQLTWPLWVLYFGGITLYSTGYTGSISFTHSGVGDYYRYADVTDKAWNKTIWAEQTIHVVAPTTPTVSWGWWGGGSLQRDTCPDGDSSHSYYDGNCGTSTSSWSTDHTDTTTNNTANQLNTTENTTAIVATSYSDEIIDAYHYAYDKGITTMPTIDEAMMMGTLQRGHMAKMIVNYAIQEMKKVPDTSRSCRFPDSTTESDEIQWYIIQACQLGIMGVGIDIFRPGDTMTRGEWWTILSRVLRDDSYNGGEPFYSKHLDALKQANIMKDISNPDHAELRGFAMLMMMRSAQIGNQ